VKHSCRYSSKKAISRLTGKIRQIKDLTERRERGSREPFPTHMIFDHAWPFRFRFESDAERRFLLGRIRSYVYSNRRGRVSLPSRYADLEDEISSLTKSQIKSRLYKVKPCLAAEVTALRSTFDYANRVLTRRIWKFSGKISEDCARRVDCHRLASRDWPRNPGSLWPSSPSVSELLVMGRSGKVPDPLFKYPRVALSHLTVLDTSRDSHLATQLVSDNVIGIRSTVTVPRKFLPWFRYRDGILFLTVRHHLPIGLVRLLLGQWKVNPHNLWLRVKCRLKYYLRITARVSKVGTLPLSSPVDVREATYDSLDTSSKTPGTKRLPLVSEGNPPLAKPKAPNRRSGYAFAVRD